jgi:hypothetical protein
MFGVFDWADFLDLAEALAAEPNNEAAARSAISRAYYAPFHVGRHSLVRKRISVDHSHNAHRQVQEELREHSAEIAEDVLLLHFWHKKADYENPFDSDVAEQTMSSVALARERIHRIRALR